MLFAISGSQGSGKSTVLAKLEELGYSTIKRKTSRSIMDEWGVTLSEVNNDRELTVKFQDEILKRKQDDESIAIKDVGRIWFTERTYADLFTYALVSIGKDNEYSEWLDDYFNRCKDLQNQYAHNFYLRGGMFQVQHDGVRGVNQHYVRMVDLVMQDVVERMATPSFLHTDTYPMKTTQITTMTVGERVNEVLSVVSPYAPGVPYNIIEQEYDEKYNSGRISSVS